MVGVRGCTLVGGGCGDEGPGSGGAPMISGNRSKLGPTPDRKPERSVRRTLSAASVRPCLRLHIVNAFSLGLLPIPSREGNIGRSVLSCAPSGAGQNGITTD